MGVIYAAADDVADLLVPFVAGRGGLADAAAVKSLYTRASLGELSADGFWEAVGLSPAIEDEYLAGLMDFLCGLPLRVGALWCLSNDVPRWSRILRRRHGLERYFDGFVISGEVRSRKPDEGIFQAFLDKASCPASACLFVDDRPANLDAAAALGFRTVLFGMAGARGTSHPAAGSFPQLAAYLQSIG